MITQEHLNRANSGVKWIHVEAQGFLGFQTVAVWAGETVDQFKQLLGLDAGTTVTVPTAGLPLPEEARLFEFVKNFDTVVLNA